jgi:hypothetical protein
MLTILTLIVIVAITYIMFFKTTINRNCNGNCNQGRNCTCKVKRWDLKNH